MKRMRHVMALAVMLAMAGCAMGAIFMMPGGTDAQTSGAGATTGYAYSFATSTINVPTDWIQADILSVASLNGAGEARSTTHVDSLQTRTVDTRNPTNLGNYVISAGAQGNTEAHVQSTSATARVTAVGRIHSRIDVLLDGGPACTADSVTGDAWISSAIGRNWVQIAGVPPAPSPNELPGTQWYQEGILAEKPRGIFTADATAHGEATYGATLDDSQVPAMGETDYSQITGHVQGETTIQGEVTDAQAEIKGVDGAIMTYPITHFIPTSFAGLLPLDNLLQLGIQGMWPIITGGAVVPAPTDRDDLPALAAIGAVSFAQPNHVGGGPVTAAAVGNAIGVAAENGVIPQDSVSFAAGTVDGSASATARTVGVWTDPATLIDPAPIAEIHELQASASKDDRMAADVRVQKALDGAGAVSVLATGALSVPAAQVSVTIADTFAGVQRQNAGSAADGSDRAWAEAFIPEATWNSQAVKLDSGSIDHQASSSGNLIQEDYQLGMGSGAFLQNSKVNPAYANMLLAQVAVTGRLIDNPIAVGPFVIPPIGAATVQIVGADVMGPMAHSLGSSGWDGSGVSADAHDLRVRDFMGTPPGPFTPNEVSTRVADVDAFLWTDGTNDAQFNGMAFNPSTPVFNPAGVGQFTGNVQLYMPSPTQRETLVGMATTQPSIFAI